MKTIDQLIKENVSTDWDEKPTQAEILYAESLLKEFWSKIQNINFSNLKFEQLGIANERTQIAKIKLPCGLLIEPTLRGINTRHISANCNTGIISISTFLRNNTYKIEVDALRLKNIAYALFNEVKIADAIFQIEEPKRKIAEAEAEAAAEAAEIKRREELSKPYKGMSREQKLFKLCEEIGLKVSKASKQSMYGFESKGISGIFNVSVRDNGEYYYGDCFETNCYVSMTTKQEYFSGVLGQQPSNQQPVVGTQLYKIEPVSPPRGIKERVKFYSKAKKLDKILKDLIY
jgi:hypothetical protein